MRCIIPFGCASFRASASVSTGLPGVPRGARVFRSKVLAVFRQECPYGCPRSPIVRCRKQNRRRIGSAGCWPQYMPFAMPLGPFVRQDGEPLLPAYHRHREGSEATPPWGVLCRVRKSRFQCAPPDSAAYDAMSMVTQSRFEGPPLLARRLTRCLGTTSSLGRCLPGE